jgi:tetratricopeptide (TPR) repeat protein
LTPAEIAAEICRSLDFLETEMRDVPERQRSMRAVFDHSWRLLTDRERHAFQGLSVFRGGLTREAAQAVTGASLLELRAFVNRSLLHSTSTRRFEVHELLRQYAQEKLEASPDGGEAAQHRHCAYYSAALERWGTDLKGARQEAALAEMRADQQNARAAWEWAVERGQVARLDQAVEGLCLFYDRRGRLLEGEGRCCAAVDRLAGIVSGDGPALSRAVGPVASQRDAEGPVPGAAEGSRGDVLRVLAKVLTWQASFNWGLGRREPGRRLLRQSLDLLEEPELADQDTRAERAHASGLMGVVAFGFGDREEARRWYERSLALYRALRDDWGVALYFGGFAELAFYSGAYEDARQLGEQSLALRRALGDQWGVANALTGLSAYALEQGQIDEAECFVRESIAIRERIGHRGHEFWASRWGLARLLVKGGKFAEGHALCEEIASRCEEMGLPFVVRWSNALLGDAKLHRGQYEGARALAKMALAHSQESGDPALAIQSLYGLGLVAVVGEAYDEAHQLLQECVGLIREIKQHWILGQVLAGLGLACRGLGQLTQAGEHFREALRAGVEKRHIWMLVEVLPAFALFLSDQGQVENSLELYALASRYPYVANSQWFEDVAGKRIAAIATTLPREVVAAARERGWARDLWATAEELLEEMGGAADCPNTK